MCLFSYSVMVKMEFKRACQLSPFCWGAQHITLTKLCPLEGVNNHHHDKENAKGRSGVANPVTTTEAIRFQFLK